MASRCAGILAAMLIVSAAYVANSADPRNPDPNPRYLDFPGFEHAFSYKVSVWPEILVTDIADELHVNFHIIGGDVTGRYLRGVFLPIGGDRAVIRLKNCIGRMNLTGKIQSDDGAIAEIRYSGNFSPGPNCRKVITGQMPPPHDVPLTAYVEVDYGQLEGLYLFGKGMLDTQNAEVRYDVYIVRPQ